jgi:hypothetical protein
LTQLSSLHLAHLPITNRGLGHLRDLTGLIYLDLSWCEEITDRGLSVLNRMDKLAYLNLKGCRRVSRRAISRLKRPGLDILS